DVSFQTENIMAAEAAHDPAVWNLKSPKALHLPVGKAPYGASLLVTAPVLQASGDADARAVGAVVAEIRLGDVVREADEADSTEDSPAPRAGTAQAQPRRSLVAIDNATDEVV